MARAPALEMILMSRVAWIAEASAANETEANRDSDSRQDHVRM